MKKIAFTAFFIFALFIFPGCRKTNNDAISPKFCSEVPNSMGNPNPNWVYTPPTNTTTPATKDSYLYLGGGGWNNLSCTTTNSLYLKSISGETEVTLQFFTQPSPGTYTYPITVIANPGSCALKVTGDPAQPQGTQWQGYSGTVSVTKNQSGISATIIEPVRCKQTGFNFPVVTVTGVLGCN